MFCYQCQETAKNQACTVKGVCGKTEETSNLQDLLVHVLKGISLYAEKARDKGLDKKYGEFITDALFATITNVNFDSDRITSLIKKGLKLREELSQKYGNLSTNEAHDAATWHSDNVQDFYKKAAEVGFLAIPNETSVP
jgi:hydroxylamine reductase